METRPITDLFDARTGTVEPHEALRDYHYRRIDRVNEGEFEFSENSRGVILVHIATADALDPYLEDKIDAAEFVNSSAKFPILMRSRYSSFSDHTELCSRGIKASKSVDNDEIACTWIDRTGVVEAISTNLVYERKEVKTISTETLEKAVTSLVKSYLEEIAGVDEDFVLATMSYLNMKEVHIPRIEGVSMRPKEVDSSFIETPIVSITQENIRKQLTPLLRPFWQALGFSQSPYMTEDGWRLEYND
jgi:hypothetical protein